MELTVEQFIKLVESFSTTYESDGGDMFGRGSISPWQARADTAKSKGEAFDKAKEFYLKTIKD